MFHYSLAGSECGSCSGDLEFAFLNRFAFHAVFPLEFFKSAPECCHVVWDHDYGEIRVKSIVWREFELVHAIMHMI